MELRAIRGGDIHDVVEFHRLANGEYPEDTEYYFKSDVDKVLAEKDKELESLKASHYAEMVDAGMRERRLNHKYWNDKADEAAKMKRLIQDGEIIYLDEYCNEKDWRIMHKVWEDEETKCRAKAEEYK